jgi:hypothetical protein
MYGLEMVVAYLNIFWEWWLLHNSADGSTVQREISFFHDFLYRNKEIPHSLLQKNNVWT